MVSYSKPYLTFDEQIDLLEERGLVLDRGRALEAVAHIGYYRLSGYWYPYRQIDTASSTAQARPVRASEVVPGTLLEQVVALYDFDRRLKLHVMDALERIEVAIRVELAYTLGAIDKYAHKDPGAFEATFSKPRPRVKGKESAHREWLRKLEQSQSRSKEDFIAHFKAKYGGDLPIWVAVEVTDFGMMSVLYQNSRRPVRDAIAAKHAVLDPKRRGNGAALVNWLRVLNFTRNTCAHHSRLWNRNFVDQVSPTNLASIPELAHIATLDSRNQARLYPALAIIRHLLTTIAPGSTWTTELATLLNTFPTDTTVSLSDMGLPNDWQTRLR